jgi:putative DNA primase/helicase
VKKQGENNVVDFEAARSAAEAAIDLVPVLSEDTVAREFTARHIDAVRFNCTTGEWHIWTGSHWKRDETRRAFAWARKLSTEMALYEDAPVKRRLGSRKFCDGVEAFARADQALAVTHEHWDRDIDILGTPSGIVDLRTGELYDPDPECFITKSTAVGPDIATDCIRWLQFLDQITGGDKALQKLLQQWAGYCLTGRTIEQKLIFLYGPGGTGKSTFAKILLKIMADYGTTAAMETFADSKFEGHPEQLARLNGVRMVVASETEAGHKWRENRVKLITGGDTITARFMRQNSFTYAPQFKLTFLGNHAPAIVNLDAAIQRRLLMVPFYFKPPEPDFKLEEALEKEAAGILRWAINGAVDWYKNGLIIPKAVTEATTRYFDEQDLFKQWLEEYCEVDHDRRIYERSVDLFASWSVFAKRNGEEPGTQRTFNETLRFRGFKLAQIKALQTSGVWGIRLKQNWTSI